MKELLHAGMNPATLEAYVTPKEGRSSEDSFFADAVDAVRAVQTALGNRYDSLSMDRRIVLVDLVFAVGAEAFSRMRGVHAVQGHQEDASVLQALELGPWSKKDCAPRPGWLPGEWGKTGSRKERARESMRRNRLVFGEPELNKLREGTLVLKWGHQGPAVRYLQRLLRVAQQSLGLSRSPEDASGCFGSKTADALRAFQQKLFSSAESQRITGLPDPYTLLLLEYHVLEPEAERPKEKKGDPGLLFLDDSKRLVPISFKDFNDFFDLYMSSRMPGSPGSGTVAPLGADDLEKLKYLVGFVESANQEKIRALQEALKETLKKKGDGAKEFVKRLWKKGFWGKTAIITPISLTGLLLYYSAKRAVEGQASAFDELLLDGADALLKLARYESKPKTEGGLRTKRGSVKLKASAGPKLKEVEEGVGAGARLSVRFAWYRRIPSNADLATLKQNGYNDKRLWYCESTQGCYRTHQLRALLQAGELSRDVTVLEITTEKPTPTKVGDIALVAAPRLYSTRETVALEPGLYGNHTWDAKNELGRYEVGGSLDVKLGPASLQGTAKLGNAVQVLPSNTGTPGVQQIVEGYARDLGARLAFDLPLGIQTGTRTSTVQLSGGINYSSKIFSIPKYSSASLVTTAGVTWKVERKGEHKFSLTLAASYPLEQLNLKDPAQPAVNLRLNSNGRRFIMTGELNLPHDMNSSTSNQPLVNLRLVYMLSR